MTQPADDSTDEIILLTPGQELALQLMLAAYGATRAGELHAFGPLRGFRQISLNDGRTVRAKTTEDNPLERIIHIIVQDGRDVVFGGRVHVPRHNRAYEPEDVEIEVMSLSDAKAVIAELGARAK